MAKTQRKYDMEYKIQAVKLAKEIGGAKAAAELGHTSIKTTEIYAKLPMQYVSQNIGDKMFRAWK